MLDVNAIPGFDAQIAHVGWGALLAFTFALWTPWYVAVLLALLISGGKESIESIWGGWEPKQPWLDGLTDFSFFCIGIGAATGLLILKNYLK